MAQGPRRPFGPCWGSRSYDVEYVFSSEAGLRQTRAVTEIIFGFCNRNGYVSEQHAARLCGYIWLRTADTGNQSARISSTRTPS